MCKYTDEVVFEYPPNEIPGIVKKIKAWLDEKKTHYIKVEVFKLESIGPLTAFTKLIYNIDPNTDEFPKDHHRVAFKNAHREHFALYFKKFYNLPTNDMDRTWYQTNKGLQKIDEKQFWERNQ